MSDSTLTATLRWAGPHPVDEFCSWLKDTPFSVTLQSVRWIIPAIQSIHIFAIAAVISAAVMITLRSFGLAARDQASRAVFARFLPIIGWSLPVLLCTGALLIVAEPARSLENPAFWLKMSLLFVALVLIAFQRFDGKGDVPFWEATPVRRGAAKLVAVVFLALWVAIIFAGRWIAYVQVS
jgi:uncharacterized membrane protein SirB2